MVTAGSLGKKVEWIGVNLLRSNSDQRHISLRNINASSVREVMRTKDIITQHEFR